MAINVKSFISLTTKILNVNQNPISMPISKKSGEMLRTATSKLVHYYGAQKNHMHLFGLILEIIKILTKPSLKRFHNCDCDDSLKTK